MAPEDPAYDLCRTLQKAGYTRIVLPLLVFMSGNLKQGRRILTMSNSPSSELSLAAADDQLSLVADEVPAKCIHHWLLDEQGANPVHAVCKICSEERDFTLGPEINTSKLTYYRGWLDIHNEWLDRLRSAEALAGLPSTTEEI